MEDQNHPGVSWDANKSATSCTICNKPFGRILQRRHHCRYCGRLVCASCSTNRTTLPSSISSVATPSNAGSSSGGKDKDDLVRVCDPCYRVLTVKKEKLTQQKLQKEKKSELLKVSSFISKSLLDVYLLDGSCKNMSYDETTTVEQLVFLLLGGKNNANYLKIALFEVKQDIHNGEEYSFLPFQTLIADVFASWKNPSGGKKYPYGKIVLPVDNENVLQLYYQQQLHNATKFFNFGATGEGYAQENARSPQPASNQKTNPVSMPTGSGNTNRTMAASYATGSSYIATNNNLNDDSNHDIGDLSDEAYVMKNKLDDSQKEIERLQSLLEKTQKKLEVCKGIISRTSGAGSKHFAIGVGTGVSDGDTESVLTSNTTISSTGDDDGPVTSSNTGKSSRRESWYNPFRSGGGGNSSNNSAPTTTNKLSKSSSSANIPNNNLQSNVDDDESADGNYYANERKMYFPSTPGGAGSAAGNSTRSTPQSSAKGNSSALVPAGNSGGGAGFMLNSVEEDILKFPASYLQKTFPEQCSFIRTYFHHIDSLQHFLVKYDQFFQYMQPCIYQYYRLSAATAASQQIVSPEMLVRDSFHHSSSSPLSLSQGMSSGSGKSTGTGVGEGMVANAHSMAESLAGLYHMLVCLDGIYSQCLTLSENTRPQLRSWLLNVFPVVSRLPVVDNDSVLILIRCLMKEELLFSSIIQSVITKNIEYSCLKNILLDTGNNAVTSSVGNLRLIYNDEEDFGYTLAPLIGSSGSVAGNEEEGKEGVPAGHPGKNLANIIQYITKATTSPSSTSAVVPSGPNSNTSSTSSSSSSVLPFPFTVIKQFMMNILSTYTYVVSDYSPVFPSEFHVLNQYLVTSFSIFNQVIKAYYRFAVGHSHITVYEAYSIFLFLHQYINQLESHSSPATNTPAGKASSAVVTSSNRGGSSSSNARGAAAGASGQEGYRMQIVDNVKVKKNEVKNICLFALKNEWEKQIKERLFALGGKKAPGPGTTTGPGGASASASNVATPLGDGYGLVNPADHYAAFIPKQGNSSGNSGAGTGGAGDDYLCDSPSFPLCKWVNELMNFLTSFTQILFQTNLFQENENPEDEFGSAGGTGGEEEQDDDEVLRQLRVSLFTALFDHIQEIAPVLLDYFTTAFSTASASRTPSLIDPASSANAHHILLIGQLNSCLVFLMQFTEYYLYLGQTSWFVPSPSDPSSTASGASSPLEEKYLTICDQFHSLLMRLVALHTEKQWTYDITTVLDTGGLLKKSSNWESDMQSVVALKKMNKVYVTILSTLLLPDDYIVAGMWSNGLLTTGGASEGESGVGNAGASSSWQCLLPGFLQLLTSIKLNYLTGMTHSIVSYYLEALLTSQYTTSSSSSFNATSFNHRLMEDLQMITAFIEENRLMVFVANTTTHYIRSAQSSQNQKKLTKFLPFSKKSKGNTTGAGSSAGSVSGGSNAGSIMPVNNRVTAVTNANASLESKELLNEYINPLTHIICALNLSRKDLVAFTQQELYLDFGYQNALRLWQILLTWRQEKKEHIQQDYDSFFKAWLPQAIPAHAEKIKYPLVYLTKLKAANIVKLSTTNTLMAGNFPVAAGAGGDWDNDSMRSGRASFSMQSTASGRSTFY